MPSVNDFDEDDLVSDTDINEDINETLSSGQSSLEVRRKIEDMLEAKRLRRELEDFYDY